MSQNINLNERREEEEKEDDSFSFNDDNSSISFIDTEDEDDANDAKMTPLEVSQTKNSLKEFAQKLTVLEEICQQEIAEFKEYFEEKLKNSAEQKAEVEKTDETEENMETIGHEMEEFTKKETSTTFLKKLECPEGNGWNWNGANTKVTVSPGGLRIDTNGDQTVYANKGFPISASKDNHYDGTIIHYFEITQMSTWADCGFHLGLSPTAGSIRNSLVGPGFPPFVGPNFPPNSYTVQKNPYGCNITATAYHPFKLPIGPGAIKGHGDVYGCGVLVKAKTVALFFTLNGTLLDKQIPIRPSAVCLFPAVYLNNACLEANFGNDSAKPFKYDTDKCPGLVFPE